MIISPVYLPEFYMDACICTTIIVPCTVYPEERKAIFRVL